MRALVTGAAGFIGSHLTEHLLKNTDWELVLVDKLAYASNGLARLNDIQAFSQAKNRVHMFPIDVAQPIPVMLEREIGSIDYILHLAAETHVDNSIADPRPFVMSNVVGTMEMLQFARRLNSRLKKFVLMSTDEVFGPAPQGIAYKENDRYNSTNPYSATKAAAEELCMAWSNSYGIPVIVVHAMNNFGERQHPEKFIPNTVKKILSQEKLMVHSNRDRTKAGSRQYIHARNTSAALLFIIQKLEDNGKWRLRDKFNIVGEQEVDNLELVQKIHKLMEKVLKQKFPLNFELTDFHSSRPGHDLRYCLDGAKLARLGWEPPKFFDESLEKTVRWMLDPRNLHWLFT